MSLLDRIATRAMPQTTTSGRYLPGLHQMPTGNIVKGGPLGSIGTTGKNGVKAGTANITYASPGQPMMIRWDPASSIEAYYESVWVMKCCRTIADTLASLPFMAGKNARDPNNQVANSPLAYLLGPPPGSPSKGTTARALWAWTAVQYLVTGKVSWETQLNPNRKGNDGGAQIIGLWPLVSAALTPIPSMGGDTWWDGFEMETPWGTIPLKPENVMYAWKPSQRDWRQPESPLEAARSAISLQVGIERYMNSLLKNGLTAAHVVVTPPFEEPEMRRAWQEQFLNEFTGFDNAGKTIFGEAELSDKDQRIPQVQIQAVGTRPVDAQLLQMWQQAKIDVTVALGVPESLIGNASQRTYANADTENRNFWTITMSSLIGEIEDIVNVHLAPRLGDEVGWFDVSQVVALQSPTIFAPLAADKAVEAGILTPQDVQDLLDIADLVSPAESIETAPLGEEGEGPSTQGYPPSTAPSRSIEYLRLERRAIEIAQRKRAMTMTQSADIADKVHGYLARSYPRGTLTWVHDAIWTRKKVPLENVQMERRPGGARDNDKVASMAKAVKSGARMDPIVLVDSSADDKLRIADGYHRALAHRHAGRSTIDAYVASPATAHGPWETEMHAKKRTTRALELMDLAIQDPGRRALLGLEIRAIPPRAADPGEPHVITQILGGPSTGADPLKTNTVPAQQVPTMGPHAFKGANLTSCAACLAPVLAPIHVASFTDPDRGPTYPLAVAP